MTSPSIVIVSGMGAGPTGTGSLVAGLKAEAAKGFPAAFVLREKTPRGPGWARLAKFNPLALAAYCLNRMLFPLRVRHAARHAEILVVMHPQTIGFELFRIAVESRPYVWMYVLDAFVFCRRSYNILPGEARPCLRCLGNDGSSADRHGCVDWFRAGPFGAHLPAWVRTGRLRLMAQCESHAKLLRAHFGEEAIVRVVPLSVPDDDVRPRAPGSSPRARPLAVFHGSCHPSKGVAHVVALARLMDDWDFLIPSHPDEYARYFDGAEALPPNLHFRSMTWSTGLAEAVAAADLVLCPSAWSATVEGAILKSLARNGLVLVFPHETSFASELPEASRLSLDPDDLQGTVLRIRQAHSDPGLSARIRSNAMAFAAAHSARSRGMLAAMQAECRRMA